ncbi:MAG: ComEC/Rec2 family competence protein [Vicingaceae bacterium]
MIRLVVPFALGILLSKALQQQLNFIFLGLSSGFFLILTAVIFYWQKRYRYRWLAGVSAFLLFLHIGALLTHLYIKGQKVEGLTTEKPYHWLAKIAEAENRGDTAHLLLVEVISCKVDSVWQEKNFQLSVYAKTSKPLIVGDWIKGRSYFKIIEKPLNPYQFDYAAFMKNRGVYFQTYLDSLHRIAHFPTLRSQAEKLRSQLIANYQKLGIEGDELAVLVAISLGDKSKLGDELQEAYAGAGAMHILAVSGLHVGIVFLLFNRLLFFLKQSLWQRWLKAIVLLLIIWGFAFLTGLSPSVQRAACMFSFVVIAKALNRHSEILNSISGAAFILLIINPLMLYEVGFQLSFAAVIGIVSLHPIIYSWLTPRWWLLDQAWSLMVVSICAQLATLPFVIFYFHQFPNWFLLTNLFVIPLAFVIVAGALIVSVLFLIFQQAFLLGKLLGVVVTILNLIIERMQALPFFQTEGIWLEGSSILLLSISLISFGLYLHHKKYPLIFFFFSSIALLLTVELSIQLRQRKNDFIGLYAFREEAVYLFKESHRAILLKPDADYSEYTNRTVNQHLQAMGARKLVYSDSLISMLPSIAGNLKVSNSGPNTLIEFQGQLLFILREQYPHLTSGVLSQIDLLICENSESVKFLSQCKACPKTIIGANVNPWDKELEKLKRQQTERVSAKKFHILLEDGYQQLEAIKSPA